MNLAVFHFWFLFLVPETFISVHFRWFCFRFFLLFLFLSCCIYTFLGYWFTYNDVVVVCILLSEDDGNIWTWEDDIELASPLLSFTGKRFSDISVAYDWIFAIDGVVAFYFVFDDIRFLISYFMCKWLIFISSGGCGIETKVVGHKSFGSSSFFFFSFAIFLAMFYATELGLVYFAHSSSKSRIVEETFSSEPFRRSDTSLLGTRMIRFQSIEFNIGLGGLNFHLLNFFSFFLSQFSFPLHLSFRFVDLSFSSRKAQHHFFLFTHVLCPLVPSFVSLLSGGEFFIGGERSFLFFFFFFIMIFCSCVH